MYWERQKINVLVDVTRLLERYPSMYILFKRKILITWNK